MIPAANAMWSQTGPVAIRDGTNKEPGGRTDMWTVLAQGGLVKRWQIQLCTIQSEIEQLHTYVKIMVLEFLLLTKMSNYLHYSQCFIFKYKETIKV